MSDQKDITVPKFQRQRRWRSVFGAIFFARALVSLAMKAQDRNNRSLRSISYVALEICDENPQDDGVPFLNIHHNKITRTVKVKNFESLSKLGGVKEVAAILQTDENNGISGNEDELRRRANCFGENIYKPVTPPKKSYLSFVSEEFKDMYTTIMVLLFGALVSMAIGIIQHGWAEGWTRWYNVGSMLFVVCLEVLGFAVFKNLKQNRQFKKLYRESGDTKVEVVRDGTHQFISVSDVLVGDVVYLKTGDQIPADGLLLDGESLKVDESSISGGSNHVDINNIDNPFLLSGTKVIDGYGYMLVTSVGMNTAWGEMMNYISCDLDEETPLKVQLKKLTSYIEKVGLAAAILVNLALLIRYWAEITKFGRGSTKIEDSKDKIDEIMDVEGLSLAVALTLAYSVKLMNMPDKVLVRKLYACETMGFVTTICTDKTGTLTLNEMKVAEFCDGKEVSKDANTLNVSPNIYELLQEGIGLNTRGAICKSNSASSPQISGSPIEKAIHSWAVLDLGMNLDESKQTCQLIHGKTFDSEKRSGVLIRRINEDSIYTHWRGAAEIILPMCSYYYDRSGTLKFLEDEEKKKIATIVADMEANGLLCIAFACKKFTDENWQIQEKLEFTQLTLLGLVGLKDICRPGMRTAVESCKKAGVNVKMITEDSIHTARAIAIECGILHLDEELTNEAVVEGVQFRNYSPEERIEKIDKINVMARSSPDDKLLMVKCLREKGYVVAVIGDLIDNVHALKEADIGVCMGIQGTELAKKIQDDNFSSVVTVLRWGRCVHNNIQKFIQFRLTVNVAALVINLIPALSSVDVPLTVMQLLWVNLIMNILGALALATDRPTNELMTKPPVARSESLISNIMWRNLIAQVFYQVTVLLTLYFKGKSLFGVEEKVKNTLIFNTFILCQIFNEFNARSLERKNIFKGMHKNKLFIGIVGMTLIVQVVMVEFLNSFANTVKLNWIQWGACIGIAAMSLLIGWLVKLIPVSKQGGSAT